MLAQVIGEGAAVPAVPAVPVVPGSPHDHRAVLEQAMDEQPTELADEEQARAFLRTRIVQTRKLLNVTTSRISQQPDRVTFAYDLVEEMFLIEKPQLPRLMRYVL